MLVCHAIIGRTAPWNIALWLRDIRSLCKSALNAVLQLPITTLLTATGEVDPMTWFSLSVTISCFKGAARVSWDVRAV